jgi:hypothetical protein
MMWRALVVCVVVVGAGACPPPPPTGEGEGEGEGEGDDDPDQLDTVRLAEAHADFALRCREPGFQAILDPAFDAALTPSREQLIERFRQLFNALAGDARVVVNLTQINACFDFLDDAASPCPLAGELPGEACRAIFVGQIQPGEECARDEQCAFGYGCTASEEQCGACVQRNGVGRPCNPGGCLPGLACVNDDGEDVCTDAPPAPAIAGDPCVDDADCGQALTTGLVCRESECVELEIVDVAQECDVDVFAGAGTRVCSDGLTVTRCNDDDGDGVGSCIQRNLVGDGCTDPSECHGLEAFCEDGTCAPTGQLGDTCDVAPGGDAPCVRSLICEDDGVCRDSLFLLPPAPTCGG